MKNKKLLSLILIFTILLSSMIVLAEESKDTKGYKDGYQIGLEAGIEVGKKDFEDKIDRKDTELIKLQIKWKNELGDLDRDEEYRVDFLAGLVSGYQEGYKKGYDTSQEEEETITVYGASEFSAILGRIDGYTAYQSGSRNDWTRYIPRDREISDMFELRKESWDYEYAFIDTFREEYQKAFEEAFQQAKLSEKTYSYAEGIKDGDNYANDLATLNGKRDYLAGLSNNYTRNMPSDKNIIDKFNLSKEPKEYEDAFLAGFKFGQSATGYMHYYSQAYREAKKEYMETPDLNGQESGSAVGSMNGQYAAIIDTTSRLSNNWERHKIKDLLVENEYGLKFQSENYRKSFIYGYWNEFMKSYNETYKTLQQETNTIKSHTEIIQISGGQVNIPKDEKFVVNVDPGTYYNDVIVTIDSVSKFPTSHIDGNSERHTQASGIYRLKILNPHSQGQKTFDPDKKVTIRFESYGENDKFGIYKYHNNKWIYLPSVREDNYISTEININNIDGKDGNFYAVRVDNQLPTFHEIRGHWAKDEIRTYVKREVIYGYPEATFKPNREISRGEFVTMLSRLYDWYPPFDSTNITMFKDYQEFGYAEKAISYASYHKIVGGYEDQTFRPNNPISYKEVEIIMSRLLPSSDFKWDEIADKLIYDKAYRSKSKDSLNNKITRAEFTYLLHELNEWQY